ncbi:DgyrCDS11725 [Dimorphilus gyrociliatus]|uniref:DgyrCDS11725 n=1 Tax=Dimorphilus gyrociliatus TaxID=2664684 RepID=A0A7I8W891_9ANNE|nr:DgyrCDS11725 [Dimorphilus gyrociliatus]
MKVHCYLFGIFAVLTSLALCNGHFEDHNKVTLDEVQQNPMDSRIFHDEEHVRDHLKDAKLADEKISDEEIEFHIFEQHDSDHNLALDGIEFRQIFLHYFHNETMSTVEYHNLLKSVHRIVDICLNSFDRDNDGFLQYHEYRKATLAINNVVTEELSKAKN